MADTQNFAEKIYNAILDMDFLDYADTKEEDIQSLMDDLELLKEHGNGTLLYAIKMLTE